MLDLEIPRTMELVGEVISRKISLTPSSGRVKCLKEAGKSFGLAFISWIYYPIVNIQDYRAVRSPWGLNNRKVHRVIIDSTLLFFASPCLLVINSAKNLAGAIITPRICNKSPLAVIT